MRLNTKGRYAVMAMADIAGFGAGKTVSLAEISNRQKISVSYLEQLLAKMRRAGLATSVRGPGGGYRLAREAGNIAIAEIMQAVGEPFQMTRCNEDEDAGCVGGQQCLTHGLWEGLGHHIMSYLDNISLQDVIDSADKSRKDCDDRLNILRMATDLQKEEPGLSEAKS